MRPYRAHLSHRALQLHAPPRILPLNVRPLQQCISARQKGTAQPPGAEFEPRPERWAKYMDTTDVDLSSPPSPRNPLNYLERRTLYRKYNSQLRRRMWIAGMGLALCVVAQGILMFTYGDELGRKKKTDSSERLDARPAKEGEAGFDDLQQKPGVPDVMIAADGTELVETGSSNVPYFPRTIRVASSKPAPAATPAVASSSPASGASLDVQGEEYTLVGHGVRTVSFLSVKVYVLGLYVRTSDLPQLQAAFTHHISPMATSLIPNEKAKLREQLMDPEESQKVWDKVLRESRVRSAVRVVPTRSTDFAHLRDGWVRGIAARTQEAARQGDSGGEYEDDGFGESVGRFKALFGGKGKSPQGSVVLLTRDEAGVLGVSFQDGKGKDGMKRGNPPQDLGSVEDERISRLVWLGYLGGKSVSSEAAKKSIVDGVMELVERPVGTVGVGVA